MIVDTDMLKEYIKKYWGQQIKDGPKGRKDELKKYLLEDTRDINRVESMTYFVQTMNGKI